MRFNTRFVLLAFAFANISYAAVPADIVTHMIDNGQVDDANAAYICKIELKDKAGNLVTRETFGVADGIDYAANPPGDAAILSVVEDEKSGIVVSYEMSIFRDHFWSKKEIHANFYVYRRTGTDQDPDGRGILNKVTEEVPADPAADGSPMYYGAIIESKDTLLGSSTIEGVGSHIVWMDKYLVSTSCVQR